MRRLSGRIDLISLLSNMGINFITDKGDEVWARCPMHQRRMGKEDHNPSWSLNSRTGDHNCFSCGYGGSLLTLVMEMRECSQFEARRYVRSFGGDFSIAEVIPEPEAVPAPRPRRIPKFEIQKFGPPPEKAMSKRWLTAEACEHYGIRWRTDTDAWIIPIRTPGGELMGWQEKGPDYVKNRPYGVVKSETLFGLDKLTTHNLVLVESPLDVVYLWTLGVEGGLALFGSEISEEQKRLIIEYADELVVALDNPRIDTAGARAAVDLKQTLASGTAQIVPTRFFDYGDSKAKDPGEMDGGDVVWGIERAVHSYHWKPPKGVRRVHRSALRLPGGGGREDDGDRAAARRLRKGARQDGDDHRSGGETHRG